MYLLDVRVAKDGETVVLNLPDFGLEDNGYLDGWEILEILDDNIDYGANVTLAELNKLAEELDDDNFESDIFEIIYNDYMGGDLEGAITTYVNGDFSVYYADNPEQLAEELVRETGFPEDILSYIDIETIANEFDEENDYEDSSLDETEIDEARQDHIEYVKDGLESGDINPDKYFDYDGYGRDIALDMFWSNGIYIMFH